MASTWRIATATLTCLFWMNYCKAQSGSKFVNVALGKACNISSIYLDDRNYQCDRAVDGITNGNFVHSAASDYKPWFYVDLGRIYPVSYIILYPRTGEVKRLLYTEISVDGKTCYSIQGTLPARTSYSGYLFPCQSILYGQFVQLSRDRQTSGNDYYINFFEIQIMVPKDVSVCPAGSYGLDEGVCNFECGKNCGGGEGKNFCYQTSGSCYGGCMAGWYKPYCNEPCQSTSCVDNRCNQTTGECLSCPGNLAGPLCSACVSWYYGTDCQVQCSRNCANSTCERNTGKCYGCSSGFYSSNCESKCLSTNCLNNKCNQETGQCSECSGNFVAPACQECSLGYYGTYCSYSCNMNCVNGCERNSGNCTVCKNGFYGLRCGKTCPSTRCLNNQCHRETGKCDACSGNFIAPDCRECQDGWYGPNCDQDCQTNCYNGAPCDKTSGRCEKCAAGKLGVRCDQVCSPGNFGYNCNETCGNCFNQTSCRHDSGVCSTGCAEGFKGDICKVPLLGTEENPENNNIIIGIVVAVIGVVVVLIAVIFFVIRQRRRHIPKAGHGNSSDIHLDENSKTANNNALLSFEPTVTSHPVTKPKATVLPQVAHKPEQVNSEDNSLYQNMPIAKGNDTKQETKAVIENKMAQPHKKKNVTQSQESLVSAKSDIDTPERQPSFEADEEYNDVMESVYANTTYMNHKGINLNLDKLQQHIMDKLQSGTLEEEFSKLPTKLTRDHEAGKQKENFYKNRFNSILPYDDNRVNLDIVDGDPCSDYINASYIKGDSSDKIYIAAQGPRVNTNIDFWRMIWQENVSQIVMLTNLIENIKEKCFQYWPDNGNTSTYGPVEVRTVDEQKRAYYTIRIFNVMSLKTKESRQLEQFHYLNWFDHEVATTTPLVKFWHLARSHALLNPTYPILVHCSAGVGRTGTYVALDIIIGHIQRENQVNIFKIVQRMRHDRCNMVQNKSQYYFLHEAVLEAYTSCDTRWDMHAFDKIFSQPVNSNIPHQRLDAEFERLHQMKHCLVRPCNSVASEAANQSKNRDPHALPDDKHLVYLTVHVKGRNQYICAVFMPTFLEARGVILTQLPLPDTVVDLWRLVDGSDISTIVSLDAFAENTKSNCYWPQEKDKPLKCNKYTITLKNTRHVNDVFVCYSLAFQSENKTEVRQINILNLLDWEDEVPLNTTGLLQLLDEVLALSNVNKKPFLVQCPNGAVKSGLFCALYDAISSITHDHVVDVYMSVRQVQNVRPEAVSSVVQYRYCYEVVQKYTISQNVYANT